MPQELIIQVIHWCMSALAFMLTAYMVPGFKISGFGSALIGAVVVAFANATIWWMLFVLTLPINVLTLGLFTFFISAIVLKMCAAVVPGFEIKSWWAAIFGAVILGLSNALLHAVIV